MPTPHPRLVLMAALGHDPLEVTHLAVAPAQLAATPEVLPVLVRTCPRTIQLLFQRDDLPAAQLQQLGEAMLAPREVAGEWEDAYNDELVLLALAALRDGRLLPTPAIRRHVTALMAANEDEVGAEGPMAALLCAEALGWPLPKHARRIRMRWTADRDYERRMLYREIKDSLPAGVRTLPTLSFETPWECSLLTARAPVVIGTAPSLTLEEAEARIVDDPDLVPDWGEYIGLVAPRNAPDFWHDLPARGALPPRYQAVTDYGTHDGMALAPVSVDTCDRLTQAVDDAKYLKDAEPYLRLIRAILAEQPETGLPLYHTLLRASGRWTSASLPNHVVANCPLTPATHVLWWELVAALFSGGRSPNVVDLEVVQRTLVAHRVAFPEQQALRQPPVQILETLWSQGDEDIKILLLDHGSQAPVLAPVEPAVPPVAAPDRPARRRAR